MAADLEKLASQFRNAGSSDIAEGLLQHVPVARARGQESFEKPQATRQALAELLSLGPLTQGGRRYDYEMEEIGSHLFAASVRREISKVPPEQRDNFLAEREATARIEWRTLCQRDDIRSLEATDTYSDGSGGAHIQFRDPLNEAGPWVTLNGYGRVRLSDRDGTNILLEYNTQGLLQRYFAAGKINALLDRLSHRHTPLLEQPDAEAIASRYYPLKEEDKFVNLLLNPVKAAVEEGVDYTQKDWDPASQAYIGWSRWDSEWHAAARRKQETIYESQRDTEKPAELRLEHMGAYDRIMSIDGVAGIQVYGKSVITTTESIIFESESKKYNLGSYAIGVNILTGEIEIRAEQPNPGYDKNHFDHPSIRDGKPRFGGIGELNIKALQQKGDTVGLMKFLMRFLTTDQRTNFGIIERFWPELPQMSAEPTDK